MCQLGMPNNLRVQSIPNLYHMFQLGKIYMNFNCIINYMNQLRN